MSIEKHSGSVPGKPANIEFVVYGIPRPKERARVVRTKGGRTVSFTPQQTADWEASFAGQALAHRPAVPLDGPISITATFYLPRPASRPKRETLPDRKPDWDNLAKCVDALEGIMWTNDSRIVDADIHKRYGMPPRVEIRIEEVLGL